MLTGYWDLFAWNGALLARIFSQSSEISVPRVSYRRQKTAGNYFALTYRINQNRKRPVLLSADFPVVIGDIT